MYNPLTLEAINKIISAQNPTELSLREELANTARVGHNIYCQGKRYGNRSMVARGRAMFREAREQLRLLDVIYYGLIEQVGL